MKLNLLRIPEGRSVLSQRVLLEGEQAEWLTCPAGLMCRAEIDNMQSHIAVHIVYSGSVQLECSRCLNSFSQAVTGDFHVLLKNSSAIKQALVADDEDFDYSFDDTTDEIDIRNALFDDVITALPLKPLCNVDCPGVLPMSRTTDDGERSESRRSSDEPVDSRWNALKKLKSKQ